MPDIIIRFATENDAELVADLSRQTFLESFASQNTKENMDKFMNEQFTRQKLIDEVMKPSYDETSYETNVKNVFIAGVICGGMNTHRLFIENSREHAKKIIRAIKKSQK